MTAFEQAWSLLKGTPENMFSLTDNQYANRQTMFPAIRGILDRNPNATIEDLGGQEPAMTYEEMNPDNYQWRKFGFEGDFETNPYRTNEHEKGTPHEAMQDALHPQRFLPKSFSSRLPRVLIWRNPYEPQGKPHPWLKNQKQQFGTGLSERYGLYPDEIADGVARDEVVDDGYMQSRGQIENYPSAVRFREALENWKKENYKGI